MSELLASSASKSLSDVLGPYGWVAVVSYVVTAIATPFLRALARRLKIVDKPDGHLKPHGRPIAYLGGIAVYLGWLAGMLMLPREAAAARHWMLGLALAGGVALAVGLADDLLEIRPTAKLLGQVLASTILLVFGIGQDIMLVVLGTIRYLFWADLVCPFWLVLALSIPSTVFLVVAATNAANLLDGMDGLCGGVTGIISLMFLVLATHLAMHTYSGPHDPVRITAALAMVGAVCGFLPYNFTPATIFLGDAGSMLLGLFAASMILMFGESGVARWVFGSLVIFGLPILDTLLALVRRIRLRRSIFAGDRSHLYDQLVDRGFTANQTLAICYGLSVLYGILGLCIILVRTRYALLIYVVAAAITLYLCGRWGFLKPPVETPHEREDKGAAAERPEDASST